MVNAILDRPSLDTAYGPLASGASHPLSLEMWGGLECTYNRVGDSYFDQLHLSGHYRRPGDLSAIAGLGIKTLRFPVLFEKVCSHSPDQFDWSFADRSLSLLCELGITPIIGLLHHGSGPRYTNLLDPAFPELLAGFAAAVAERYPWIENYTPINEPLTTARFSALYGHWYPHLQDPASFIKALLRQCHAIARAMNEVRQVQPSARLIQTEDIGLVHSTPTLAYQADFENERRWLTYDLLSGRVDCDHPMTDYFRWLGIDYRDYVGLADAPCVPDILGLNYYVTSERLLDDRTHLYPGEAIGGNDNQQYVDVPAVRHRPQTMGGIATVLRQAWERYGLPLAITEAHLACTREEQARWLSYIWRESAQARDHGIDVRAVTAWSLLGAYNWDKLVTRDSGHYEPGAFDLRSGQLHPTMLARVVHRFANGQAHDHPALASPGWWQPPSEGLQPSSRISVRVRQRPIVICGAAGTLGQAFTRACVMRGLAHLPLGRAELDITSAESIDDMLDALKPWAVVNCAGFVRVDEAERQKAQCFRQNTAAAEALAAACRKQGSAFLTFSSDLVFDGERSSPYLESHPTRPLNTYGHSKAQAEQRVLAAHGDALVVRTSAFFGPCDEYNFATIALRELQAGKSFAADAESMVSPTYVPDLAHLCLDLLLDDYSGMWHLANRGSLTWWKFACRLAELAGADAGMVRPVRAGELKLAAPRPNYSVLDTERSLGLPSLEGAMHRYMDERAQHLLQCA